MAGLHLRLLPLFLALLSAIAIKGSKAYSRTLPPPKLQRLTHLHFYFHDTVSGEKTTAVRVAEAAGTNSSATLFGMVVIADNPLTEGPTMGSKMLGRAQGMYASADMNDFGLLMAFNLVFTEEKFNGSTVSLFGRNPILSAVREMPIVGGTGVFRFAKGYAQAKTYTFDRVSGNAVVEYNVYVWH
ncbi:PREDICTED: dirigent protein 21-like [Tarenaya hassleriana]|uniref:dirigent protein 21-like n=1 Tax=Tarenaya hassleriana TaxID=28532 RepID=UPI00053C84FB|nr:PREDICTED: dirigent protein 21-like [Tarenaya hassleriana]